MKNEGENHVMLSYGIKYLDMPCGSLHPPPPAASVPALSTVTTGPGLLGGREEFLYHCREVNGTDTDPTLKHNTKSLLTTQKDRNISHTYSLF